MKAYTAISMENLLKMHAANGENYHEFLKVPDMSAGLYILEVGEQDTQSTHAEDEMYYIVSGKAGFYCDGKETVVQTGQSIYVPKQMEHRFHSVVEKLQVLVFFAPTET